MSNPGFIQKANNTLVFARVDGQNGGDGGAIRGANSSSWGCWGLKRWYVHATTSPRLVWILSAAEGFQVATVDWHALARKLGTLRDDGESGGSDLGRQALELIVGVDALRSAVDYYVAGAPGRELARSVLALLKPSSAMERCLEVARSDADAESRRSAVELLRMVADRRGIDWAAEFLRDEDEGVQVWGAGIVDQLLWSGLADSDDCGQLLEAMERHPNPEVQRYAALLRSFLPSKRQAEPPHGLSDSNKNKADGAGVDERREALLVSSPRDSGDCLGAASGRFASRYRAQQLSGAR